MEGNCTEDCDHSAIKIAVTVESTIGLGLQSTVLVILVCSKAYKTFLQRLFVWIVAALIVSEVTRVTSLVHQEMDEKVCTVLGFVHLWSWWTVYMFLTAMIVYLLIKVYRKTRDNSTVIAGIAARLKNSKSLRIVLEIGIVLALLTTPMAVLWFPFYANLYGHNDIRCVMKSSLDLPKYSEVMEDIIAYSPQNLAAAIAIVVALCLMMQYHMLRQHRVARQVIKKLILSLLIVVFFSIADNAMLALAYYLKVDGFHFNMARTCASLMITGAIKTVLLLGYLLGFHFSITLNPFKKLRRGRNHKAAGENEYDCNEYGTFRKSSRDSAPSHTTFNPSHTADFESTSSSV